MNKTDLEAKLQLLETQFATLNNEKAEVDKRRGDIEAELFRLQGDYRTIQELLKEFPTSEVDPALVVEAKEDTEKDAK